MTIKGSPFNIMKTLKKLFKKKQPTMTMGIFKQTTWLEKQVAEAMWKRSFGLD